MTQSTYSILGDKLETIVAPCDPALPRNGKQVGGKSETSRRQVGEKSETSRIMRPKAPTAHCETGGEKWQKWGRKVWNHAAQSIHSVLVTWRQ